MCADCPNKLLYTVCCCGEPYCLIACECACTFQQHSCLLLHVRTAQYPTHCLFLSCEYVAVFGAKPDNTARPTPGPWPPAADPSTLHGGEHIKSSCVEGTPLCLDLTRFSGASLEGTTPWSGFGSNVWWLSVEDSSRARPFHTYWGKE